MTFATDETSQADSQPRLFFEITHGATTYYVASADRDIIYNGFTFAASPSMGMEIAINPLTAAWEYVLVLPTTHPLVARYTAMGGVPPKQITVTARRMQLTSGQVQQIHIGYVTSMGIDGHQAKFRIPSRTGASLDRNLPPVLFDSTCANVLYDNACTVIRASYAVTTTAFVVDGKTITVASIGGNPDNWAQFGELLHVPSGERMTITQQIGTQVTMQFPIYELHNGDAVQVFAGCDHAVATCNSKFANKDNFTGSPNKPTRDLYLPTGLGVMEYT